MLITFRSKAYADILMMGEVGKKMLEMMDFGSNVPGAINAEDVAEALHNLHTALARVPATIQSAAADDDQPAVSLHTRALPLIKLLEASIAEQEYVRWQ